ncbi:cyclophilin-like domain-containing protein, partial [Thamnocephalis sphaerospora]
DKLYITHSEWSNEYGGSSFGGARRAAGKQGFRRLPFDCCALSLRPFEHPVCTKDGIVFDLEQVHHSGPYLQQEGVNPVTGERMKLGELTKLNFFKNADGEYHCPITLRVFNENTHIVAVGVTGNVYAQEAIERLNVKAKHWRDLMTDEPFTRKDLITLQDPHNLELRNLSNFQHVKQAQRFAKPGSLTNSQLAGQAHARSKADAKAEKTTKEQRGDSASEGALDGPDAVEKSYFASSYSTGRAAASLTSTAMAPETTSDRILLDRDHEMYDAIKTKGYAQIKTNLGDLNVELFCDQIPQTCHNFILLAKSGYYRNVLFHRLIRNFMASLQGGDPTGTGRGGESYWKRNFPDQFKQNLQHTKRGVLSMANRGKDTNSSQFFITFRPCKHLDNKHTVFGQVVGGLPVLDTIERIPTDDDDRPTKEVRILDVKVFVDPFTEYQERRARKLEKLREAKKEGNTSAKVSAPLGSMTHHQLTLAFAPHDVPCGHPARHDDLAWSLYRWQGWRRCGQVSQDRR